MYNSAGNLIDRWSLLAPLSHVPTIQFTHKGDLRFRTIQIT